MNFYRDHVNGGCAAVARIRDAISSDCEPRAVGVHLFRSVVDTDPAIGGIFASVGGDVVAPDEHDSVGARALPGDALG